MEHQCGSLTLYKDGEDAVCKVCSYVIKNYKELEMIMGKYEFKKFERGIKSNLSSGKNKV